MPDEPRVAPTDVRPTIFRMRAQLLDDGRSNTPLAETENMWARLKVNTKDH